MSTNAWCQCSSSLLAVHVHVHVHARSSAVLYLTSSLMTARGGNFPPVRVGCRGLAGQSRLPTCISSGAIFAADECIAAE